MKLPKKQWIAAGVILVLAMQLPACSRTDNLTAITVESPPLATAKVTDPIPKATETPAVNHNPVYDPTLTITENIIILNKVLEDKYRQCLSVSGAKEYEAAGKPGWTLILDGEKVGFDTTSWIYGYEPDSADARYMDAILTTFLFFYGEDMGNSLFQLTIDLFDDGADETEYGFKHDGGQIVYKDTRTAMIGYPDDDQDFTTIYIWMTPNETGEYKDLID